MNIKENNMKWDEIYNKMINEEVSQEQLNALDENIYFLLLLINEALEGDEKALNSIEQINSIIDRKVARTNTTIDRKADKYNQLDDKRVASKPQMKRIFLQIMKKMNETDKELARDEESSE